MAVVNKRMVLKSFSNFQFEDASVPEVPEGGVVLKVTNAGICYSDVHMAHTPKFHPKFVYPRVLGHEIAGVIHSMSDGANTARPDLAVGDKVVVFPWGNCQKCNYCKSGDCSFCLTMAYGAGPVGAYVYGVWRDGGYENYVAVDIPGFLLKVPANIPMNQAATIPCSGLTSYNAVTSLRESIERAQKINGLARIALVGSGGLALWAIQISKALYGPNIEVIAIDINKEKLTDAKAHGADQVYQWDKDESTEEAVEKLVSSCGRMDGIVDYIGLDKVTERAFLSLNIGGTLTLVGLSGGLMPQMTMNSVIRRNVTIRGNMVGSQEQLKVLLKLVEDGKVVPPPVYDVQLEDVPDVMQKMIKTQQRGRAVIQM